MQEEEEIPLTAHTLLASVTARNRAFAQRAAQEVQDRHTVFVQMQRTLCVID